MDCAIEHDGTIVLVIDEWVGECTIRLWKSRSSNNEHMARCQGCSMVMCLMLTDCTFMLKNRNSLSASHQRRNTDIPSQWMDLSGKWSCVRSHSLFLQRSMSTGTRIATCRLTRAGAASWVEFTNNQSTLTSACSCCACRSILLSFGSLM